MDNGIYEIQLATVTFDDLPANPNGTTAHERTSSILAEGGARRLSGVGVPYHWITLLFIAQVFPTAGTHRIVTMMT